MTTKNAIEVLSEIEAAAKSNPQDVRMVRTMEVGGPACRQGDIYVWRIKSVPKGATKRGERQLALGTTKGSRHVAAAGPSLYDLPQAKRHALLGPIVKAPERWTIEHPEHAHVSLPAGCYQIGYQLDARTRRAVAD